MEYTKLNRELAVSDLAIWAVCLKINSGRVRHGPNVATHLKVD